MIFPHFTEKKYCKISLYISSRYVIDLMSIEVQYKGKLTVSEWLEFIDYVLHCQKSFYFTKGCTIYLFSSTLKFILKLLLHVLV